MSKQKKRIFVWVEATPAERAAKLLDVGDPKTARQDIKEPCCICGQKIRETQEYRVYHNNNHWKGHEECIKNGGKHVAQIRNVLKRADGGHRIYWNQLPRLELAATLFKYGKRYEARANTPDHICAMGCNRRIKSGDQMVKNAIGDIQAHFECVKQKNQELEAKQAAEIAAARQKARETAPTITGESKVVPMFEQPAMVAEETVEQYQPSIPELTPAVVHQPVVSTAPSVGEAETIASLKAQIKELEAKVERARFEGFKEAMAMVHTKQSG